MKEREEAFFQTLNKSLETVTASLVSQISNLASSMDKRFADLDAPLETSSSKAPSEVDAGSLEPDEPLPGPSKPPPPTLHVSKTFCWSH